jgi:hypothetical protein
VLLLDGPGGFDRQIVDYSRYAAAVAKSGFDAYLVYYRSEDEMKRLATSEDVLRRGSETGPSQWVIWLAT